MRTIVATIALTLLGCFSSEAYTNLGGNVFQSNGTDSDTQAAISAAPGGGTVQIPNGTFTWSRGISVSKAIKLRGASAGGVTINNNVTGDALVQVTPVSSGSTEILNLVFREGSAQTTKTSQHHLQISYAPGAQPVLLHDCSFFSNGHILSQILWVDNGGVIWNCTFDANFSSDESLQFKNSAVDTWQSPSTMGTADTSGRANTYVEDCRFQHSFLETIDLDDGSRTVIRHCTFDNAAIVSHGQDSSPFGNRHWEIYNNNFIFTLGNNDPNPGPAQYPLNLQGFMLMRGGTGVIANNTIPNVLSMAWGDKGSINFGCFSITQYGCYTSYPIPRQVGQSWSGGGGSYPYPQLPSDGSGYITDPVYIWGNSGGGNYDNPGYFDFTPDQCGHGLTSASVIHSGRDYIVGKPKPGYTPFTYPHPLRAASAAPQAPQNLRVVK
jgi:hypothetical protein